MTNLKENVNLGSGRTKNRQTSGRINDRKPEVIGFPNDLHMIKTQGHPAGKMSVTPTPTMPKRREDSKDGHVRSNTVLDSQHLQL